MKKTLTILLLLTMTVNAIAQKNKENKAQFIGTWKFSNQSRLNDFQKVFDNKQQDIKTEYFTFESNHVFKHEFLNKDGKTVKTLNGKWKSAGEKIKIEYSGIEYSILLDYFFLDKDLVLGQNFNHIIFSPYQPDQNVALK